MILVTLDNPPIIKNPIAKPDINKSITIKQITYSKKLLKQMKIKNLVVTMGKNGALIMNDKFKKIEYKFDLDRTNRYPASSFRGAKKLIYIVQITGESRIYSQNEESPTLMNSSKYQFDEKTEKNFQQSLN
mgnify:CR=1 FL=1